MMAAAGGVVWYSFGEDILGFHGSGGWVKRYDVIEAITTRKFSTGESIDGRRSYTSME